MHIHIELLTYLQAKAYIPNCRTKGPCRDFDGGDTAKMRVLETTQHKDRGQHVLL